MLTLRNRFAVLFVTFAVLISVLVGLLTWNTARRILEDEINDKHEKVTSLIALGTQAEDIMDYLPGYEAVGVWQARQRDLDQLQNDGYVQSAQYFAWRPGAPAAEALVTDRPDIHPRDPLQWVNAYPSELQQAYDHGRASTPRAVGDNGQFYRWAIERLRRRQQQPQPGVNEGEAAAEDGIFLAVRMPANYEEPLTRLSLWIVGLSLLTSVLAGLAGWKIAGWIVARLENLSRAALRIQRGWMNDPVPVSGEDEISRLARAMERMRGGIRRRDEQLRLMLSRVAHEIRNPLGGLELFASAAQDAEDPGERRQILGQIRKEVLGLNAIIEEFLGFGQPAQAKPKIHDVRRPVSEAAALAEAEIVKNGGRLHLDVPPRPLHAVADPAQVKRMVLNLVRNAADAGETVWVEGAMVNGEVRIVVRDDGPGVAADLRDRVFEPFVSDKEKGAGLGLAIVKEIAETSRGRVELICPQEPQGSGDGQDGGDRRDGGDERDSGGGRVSGDGRDKRAGAEFHVYLRGPENLPSNSARASKSLWRRPKAMSERGGER